MAMLEVRDLHTSFFTPAGEVKAVNGVSFNLDEGRVLGIVRQERNGLFHPADSDPSGPHRFGQHQVPRAGARGRGRARDAQDSRQ